MFEDYLSNEIWKEYYTGTDYYLVGNYIVHVILWDTLYINNQELLWRRMHR